MEGQDTEEKHEKAKGSARWRSIGRNLDSVRQTITRLVIQACKVRPDLTKVFLDRLLQADEIRSKKFKEISAYSPFLAENHADKLVELSLKHFIKEPPTNTRRNVLNLRRRPSVNRQSETRTPPTGRPTRFDISVEPFRISGSRSGLMIGKRSRSSAIASSIFPRHR